MTDFASLGIKIDSSQARQAVTDLDKLAAVGEKVAESIDKAAESNKQWAKTASEGAKASKANADSIDKYVQSLQKVAATNGMSAREAKLYDLALQGATKSQLAAADAAIKLDEGYKRGLATGQKIREGFSATAAAAVKLGAALGTAAVGGVVLFNKVNDGIAKWQELSEKTGETAENISSLQTASDVSGVSLDTVAAASIRLTTALAKTDDESKLVAKGVKALGLNFQEFKQFSPAQQLDAVAKAMSGLANGTEKTAAITAIYGKSAAEIIPFLNDLADGGERQIRLTNEQIQAADEHSKAQARLRSEITSLAQVVVSQSLPAVTDLTGAIKDAIAQVTGLDGAANSLSKNNSIGQFSEDGARFLATLLDMADKVVFAFQYVGKSIAAAAAVAAAAAHGEFKQAGAIIDAAREDGQALLNRPNFADALDKRIAERRANEAAKRQEQRGFTPEKPKAGSINTDRARKGRDTAGQEAKAQLAFDLEDIRKAQEAIINTIANGEKVLEAKRSANLITEEAYWDQKKQFLIENNQAQQEGLEKELARLQQEKLTGKDAINNQRKILDVEAKLAKTRQDGATNLEVLSIRQADALDKIKIKFETAQKAADDYVDTIAKANQRELSGFGLGNRQREIDARRNQRDDQFQQRRDQLYQQFRAGDFGTGQAAQDELNKYLDIAKDSHDRVLKEDARYWAGRAQIEADGIKGSQDALQNYIDYANNAYDRGNKIVSDTLHGFTDSLTEYTFDSDLSHFKDFGIRMGKQILAGLYEAQILKPFAEYLQSGLQGQGGILSGVVGALTGSKAGGKDESGFESLISRLAGGGSGASTGMLASSATAASTSLGTLSAAAASAASSLALISANSIGSSGGDALGALIGSMGWSEGGFTGPGGKYQPAGIVHAGEGVLSQAEVRAIGGEAGFNSLRRMIKRGYADGGFVSAVVGGNLSGGGGNVNNNTSNLQVHNHFAAGTDAKTVDQAALKFQRILSRTQRNV